MQTLEGSTTLPWVPRSGEEVAQGGTFHRCKGTAALLHTRRFRTATRIHSGTLMLKPKGMLCACS